MKIQYKLGLLALGAISMVSCEKHDLILEPTNGLGQEVPACYWVPASTVCKAGESFGFLGKYTTNTEAGLYPDRSEVQAQVTKGETMSIQCKLGGLSYSLAKSVSDTVRAYQTVAVFPHEDATWENYREWHINGTVPVSRTLSPVKWADIATWDQENFDLYAASVKTDTDKMGLAEEFLNTVIGYMTNEETADSYYDNLRNIYINYDFTNEDFANVGLPVIEEGEDKSDVWTSDTETIVKYYRYNVVDGESVYEEIEVADYENLTDDEKKVAYPIYDSCEWVYCRYDFNSGQIINTVRPEWLPNFRALLETIPFQEWIWDAQNGCYKVDFTRSYSLNTRFCVYDQKGNEGRAYDIYSISVN